MRVLSPWILFGMFIIAGCGHHASEHAASAVYSATTPLKKDTIIDREYVCQIRSIQHIELRAIEEGYVEHIYVDEGEIVHKGQLLFLLQPLVYQAEKQKAEAEAAFAEVEYMNTKVLADSNIVSRNELALAKARLDKARAELALASAHLGFTEIRAPFDGMVGRLNDTRTGTLVDKGELLTTLSDNNRMWVYFNVPETQYLFYARQNLADSLLQVKLRLADNEFFDQPGVVETIEADFNNETGNIAFRATFLNPDGILRNGETGNIVLPSHLKEALLIPQQATFEILDKKYVYVLHDSLAQAKEITIGAEMPHLFTVVEGLSETDTILTDGLRKVKNGDRVRFTTRPLPVILDELHHLRAE